MWDYLSQVAALRSAGRPFALATVVRAEKPTSAKVGAKAIVTVDGILAGWVGGSCAQPTVIREALHALQDGRPRLLRLCPPERLGLAPQEGVVEVALTCISGGTLEIYIDPHLPKPLLVVVGHLPVVEALATLGKGLNFSVAVMGLDADHGRFAAADVVLDRLDFSRLALPAQTYIVVASHGNYDEPALTEALQTDAAYIALVASKKRAQAVIDDLRDSGVSADRLSRLKYPAGLDIGAVTPEEIAISILAEIVQLSRQAPRAAVQIEARAEAVDPVCGMLVEIAGARHTADYGGQVYYFCCAGCQRSFTKDPEEYSRSPT